jgi:integrase
MATLNARNGVRYIQWPGCDGHRKTLSLGHTTERNARTMLAMIEDLVSARGMNVSPRLETSRWLANLGDNLHRRLAESGLIEPREQTSAVSLDAFCHAYIDGRTDIKPRTRINLEQARQQMARHFGKTRDIRTITRGDAQDWHQSMFRTLARATVSTHIKKARQIFRYAVDRKLISDNPFLGVKAGGQKNESRQAYVPTEQIKACIDASPDAEWRLIFALARFAGLRVPSETRALTWASIDFGRLRMRVHSPKTEHHEGREHRIVPIFPELLPYLRDAFEAAEPGQKHVIARHRGDNLSTTGHKIALRAGLHPWKKFFQNLRSSCQTDLADAFPLKVVCSWIGNTEIIAMKHYLQVTDDHFDRATGRAATGAAVSAGQDRTESEQKSKNPQKTEGLGKSDYPQGESNPCPLAEKEIKILFFT